MDQHIPKEFVEYVERGECTIFLGAGASRVASAPSGGELSELICREILGLSDCNMELERASSLVSAQQGGRGRLEKLVVDQLDKLSPAPAHKRLPWYRWKAIITTNYDTLIEDAYISASLKMQSLYSIIMPERLGEIQTNSDTILLIKPHGCISRPESMVLSRENLYDARIDRRLLFTQIEVLHLTGPVIYIGYSLSDVHVLDIIYEITKRLDSYRKPILFVTKQGESLARYERRWFELVLKGEYLTYVDGFRGFIDELSKRASPAVAPSLLIEQLAPCNAITFKRDAEILSYSILQRQSDAEWECWLTYRIDQEAGYAGTCFERFDVPLDISMFKKVTFNLNIPSTSDKLDAIEFKLESFNKQFVRLLNLKEFMGKGWKEVSFDLDVITEDELTKKRLRKITLANNGGRVDLGKEYKVGICKIRFE